MRNTAAQTAAWRKSLKYFGFALGHFVHELGENWLIEAFQSPRDE
jgi:hypothetical protein